jgi:uncharacterized repeat protein (TIGR01451 family)
MSAIVALFALGSALSLGPGNMQIQLRQIEVYTRTLTLSTYPFASFLETRHSDTYNMDYPWLDWSAYQASGPQPAPRSYLALIVENQWLRLTFLPELGGRLYGVTNRATGEELLYQNPVLKPTHWGPSEQPWWMAVGGIEWCLPVDEHGYEWAEPWNYAVSTTAEGVSVTLWDTIASDRVRAQIRVDLPADRAAFKIRPRLENPTAAPVTFKFWNNAMLAPGAANTVGPDLRFVVPIDQVTVHSRGDSSLPGPGEAMNWPVQGGTDYSRLGNWNQWLGFFARPHAAQDWAGVYDESTRRGVARVFPHQVATGVKGFGFGWQQPIDWHLWTDDGSQYVELHGGPSPTFWDSVTLGSGQVLEWTETWLPLQNLPRLSLATQDLALGLKAVGSDLRLGLLVAGQRNNLGLRLWRRDGCAPLWRTDGLDLGPGEAYQVNLPGLGLGPPQVVLGVVENGMLLVQSGDLTCAAPTSQVELLNPVQTTTGFTVYWSTTDPGDVRVSFDIQVRDGDADAPWADWLTNTTATSAPFSGQDGHTYTFRSRVRDLFGRVESWPTEDWQDTSTTVLLQPAPALTTSYKAVEPHYARAGDTLAFEIHLRNTGNLAASVRITDSLPAYLELASSPVSSQPPEPLYDGDARTLYWHGSLAPAQSTVLISFDARVLWLPPSRTVSNVVWIDDGQHPALRRQVTTWQRTFLPILLKNLLQE